MIRLNMVAHRYSVLRLATLSLFLVFGAAPALGQSFTGVVTEVKDGDTFHVQTDGEPVVVRLHGLDAPEPSQPYGDRATTFLRRRIAGEEVRVQVVDRDRFGRLVSTVYHDGGEVNAQLLRAGLAWYYWWYVDYTVDAKRDQTREYRAQQAGRGLWAQSTPIPPWEWRDAARGATYAKSGPTGLRYNPASGPSQGCDAFDTQDEAQRFYEAALPGVGERLDEDGDGVACESLPAE